MAGIITECVCGELPALPRNQQLDAYDRAKWGASLSNADLDAMRARSVAAALEPAARTGYSYGGTVNAERRAGEFAAAIASVPLGEGSTAELNELIRDARRVCAGLGISYRAGGCDACGAEAGEECRPVCTGLAAAQDEAGEDVTA